MQKPVVMAFRRRLHRRGYSDISICRCHDELDTYIVTAKEPLAHKLVSRRMTVTEMYNSMR